MTDEYCGYKTIRCPDDIISGHIEYETETLCGESLITEDYHEYWKYCPYCGKKIKHKD